MTIRLSDLSQLQICAMAKLDDGDPHEDSVGREIEDLDISQIMVCAELVRMGLAETRFGWRGSFWFWLTEAGHLVLMSGVE